MTCVVTHSTVREDRTMRAVKREVPCELRLQQVHVCTDKCKTAQGARARSSSLALLGAPLANLYACVVAIAVAAASYCKSGSVGTDPAVRLNASTQSPTPAPKVDARRACQRVSGKRSTGEETAAQALNRGHPM